MPGLHQIKRDCLKAFDESHGSIKRMNDSINSKKNSLKPLDIYSIYEISFLKIFTNWERFLENTFVAYLSGKTTGNCKPQKITKKISEERAYDLLVGTKNYPDWANLSDVKKLAELFFENDCLFTKPLDDISTHFNEMKRIRNTIAHISKNAHDKFITIVRNKLPQPHDSITPGDFLSQFDNNGKAYIVLYTDYLKYAINKIVY